VAFVTPKTWSFGEVLTSTDMNLYVRDNTADLDARVAAIPTVEGIGPNVVQAVKTDTQAASTASGAVLVVSDLTCTITPSSNTSKVLVIYDLNGLTDAGAGFAVILKRDGTVIGEGVAVGSRTAVTGGGASSASGNALGIGFAAVLDSPATTDPVSYTLEMLNLRDSSAILTVNRTPSDTNAANGTRSASRITAIEVKA